MLPVVLIRYCQREKLKKKLQYSRIFLKKYRGPRNLWFRKSYIVFHSEYFQPGKDSQIRNNFSIKIKLRVCLWNLWKSVPRRSPQLDKRVSENLEGIAPQQHNTPKGRGLSQKELWMKFEQHGVNPNKIHRKPTKNIREFFSKRTTRFDWKWKKIQFKIKRDCWTSTFYKRNEAEKST